MGFVRLRKARFRGPLPVRGMTTRAGWDSVPEVISYEEASTGGLSSICCCGDALTCCCDRAGWAAVPMPTKPFLHDANPLDLATAGLAEQRAHTEDGKGHESCTHPLLHLTSSNGKHFTWTPTSGTRRLSGGAAAGGHARQHWRGGVHAAVDGGHHAGGLAVGPAALRRQVGRSGC